MHERVEPARFDPGRALACAVLVTLCVGCATDPAEEGDADRGAATDQAARASLEALTSARPDTPGGQSLLATLAAEIRIAGEHGAYAARRRDDLAWVHLHIAHLRHALDPASEADGPGLGYGVVAASRDLAKHAGRAGGVAGATARAVSTIAGSAANIARWADEVLILAANVLAESSDAGAVAGWLTIIDRRLHAMRDGADVDRNGRVEAESGEGGLAHLAEAVGRLDAGRRR